jgi:hypothetical protein
MAQREADPSAQTSQLLVEAEEPQTSAELEAEANLGMVMVRAVLRRGWPTFLAPGVVEGLAPVSGATVLRLSRRPDDAVPRAEEAAVPSVRFRTR